MSHTEWTVFVEAIADENESAIEDSEIFTGISELLDLLADYGASTAGDHRGWSVYLTVDDYGPDDATKQALELVRNYAEKVGLPMWPFARIETVRADILDAEQSTPNLPDLVGTQEVTSIMGISRQRLHELRSTSRFPEPIVQLASGPVWVRPAIDNFLEGWNRRPGRPSKEELAEVHTDLREVIRGLEES